VRLARTRVAIALGIVGLLLLLAGTWWLTARGPSPGPERVPTSPSTPAPSASARAVGVGPII
jgi:hypothetical protein